MATRTKAELKTRISKVLKIAGADEATAASAEELDEIDEFIDEAHEQLEIQGIAYWATSAIPLYVFEHVAQYTAGLASSMVPDNERGLREQAGDAALRRLYSLTAEVASNEPARAEYF